MARLVSIIGDGHGQCVLATRARLFSSNGDGHMAMHVSNKEALWRIVSGYRRGGSYEDACSNKRPYGGGLVSIITDAGWQYVGLLGGPYGMLGLYYRYGLANIVSCN